MKRIIAIVLILLMLNPICVQANPTEDGELKLYALSAVLIDGSNNRILYGKKENEVRAMASTTKIMTLIIALEKGNIDDEVVFSKYAASQPDVQLNANCGEKYRLQDLLNIMMQKSYNDVAVAIAEHIGAQELQYNKAAQERTGEESLRCVRAFVDLMNQKATEIGCSKTCFITPNGLDAKEGEKMHSTTAYELAVISSYAIRNPDIEKICMTSDYACDELTGKRHVNVVNSNAFLQMMDGAVGMKTGFTGEAGYCFVGAVKQSGRVFVSVVLGSGWPPNKSYKWKDTKLLMNYGVHNYFMRNILVPDCNYAEITVRNGIADSTSVEIKDGLDMLCADYEKIDVVYILQDELNAPVKSGDVVGKVEIYTDKQLYTTFPIYAKESVEKVSFVWYLRKILNYFMNP